jgi:hypothetical protein
VSKWLGDVGKEDNHIKTIGNENPRATTAVEEIGVLSNNTKQATNPTHDHTEVNSPKTKDAHHGVIGTTEPNPQLNNPVQTEQRITLLIKHTSTTRIEMKMISIKFRTLQSN